MSFVALLTVTSHLLLAFATPLPRDSNCPCGYKDDTGAVWRESIISNFVEDYDNALSQYGVQTWGPVSREATTYQLKYDADNVYQSAAGLSLRTKAYNPSQGVNGIISSAELDSRRDDILYGTFRMRAAVPNVPGVCLGFFTYKKINDKVHETDIELLTSDVDYKNRIHYTNQPGNVNGNADPDAYKEVTVDGDLSTMSDHRFDWGRDSVKFYYNGVQTQTISKNTPSVPSYLIANLWSDGGPGWTKGPPSADAVATVQFIYGYFNSSALSEETFSSQCRSANTPACNID